MNYEFKRKVDSLGRVVIPDLIRKNFRINPNDFLLIRTEGNEIIISRENKDIKCDYTGRTSSDVKHYGNGVFLSEEGKRLLIDELSSEE